MATIANLTTILVTARIAAYGATAVAAYGVSARIEFLMVPLAFGVGSALTALVGRAVGAGDWVTARRTAWAGGLMALAVTLVVGVFVSVFPGWTASAFSRDPAVVAIATQALAVIGFALPGFGVGMALYFASMGAGRMLWPAVAAISRITLAVGGGWVLGDWLGMGLQGQFIAVALGISAYGIVTALRRSGRGSGRRGSHSLAGDPEPAAGRVPEDAERAVAGILHLARHRETVVQDEVGDREAAEAGDLQALHHLLEEDHLAGGAIGIDIAGLVEAPPGRIHVEEVRVQQRRQRIGVAPAQRRRLGGEQGADRFRRQHGAYFCTQGVRCQRPR